jgi:hypothetical protein
MHEFCISLGVTEPQKPIANISSQQRRFFNVSTEHYPNPPITPAIAAYLMTRVMAPLEFLPDSLHVDYPKLQHFFLPFSGVERKQLLARMPKTYRIV